jgi:DNA invertase Pin-like site-specific DNA recombinase
LRAGNVLFDLPSAAVCDEEPGGRQRWLKTQRDRQIARLYMAQGVTVSELAQMFSVSQRTVQRALKKNSKEIRNG